MVGEVYLVFALLFLLVFDAVFGVEVSHLLFGGVFLGLVIPVLFDYVVPLQVLFVAQAAARFGLNGDGSSTFPVGLWHVKACVPSS